MGALFLGGAHAILGVKGDLRRSHGETWAGLPGVWPTVICAFALLRGLALLICDLFCNCNTCPQILEGLQHHGHWRHIDLSYNNWWAGWRRGTGECALCFVAPPVHRPCTARLAVLHCMPASHSQCLFLTCSGAGAALVFSQLNLLLAQVKGPRCTHTLIAILPHRF